LTEKERKFKMIIENTEDYNIKVKINPKKEINGVTLKGKNKYFGKNYNNNKRLFI
jgi:hypothetical protein